MKKQVFIVDDHALFSKSLEMLINNFENYNVAFCAKNGMELISHLEHDKTIRPDLILLDLNMPVMNGEETMTWLSAHRPEIPVLILSMLDNEEMIIKMIRKGVKGYLLKDISPEVLQKALDDTLNIGFFHSEKVTLALMNSLHFENLANLNIRNKELQFLQLSCSELTYKEIADRMKLSPKTVDNYRISLFEKLDVKSRVGLVLYAVKHGLYSI